MDRTLFISIVAGFIVSSAHSQADAGQTETLNLSTTKPPAAVESTVPPTIEPDSPLPGEAESDELITTVEEELSSEIDEQAPPPLVDLGISREQARELYRTHVAAEQYDEALTAARYSLALTEQEYGPLSLELVPALHELGDVLLRTKQPDKAFVHYERSEKLIQDQQGIFARELFTPYMGKGLSLQQLGEHDAAIDEFRRGQHVIHRNDGVLGLEQLPAIRAVALSLRSQGEFEEAEEVQLLTYKIYKRKFGADDVRVVPGLFSIGDWYLRRGDYRQATAVFEKVLELETESGEFANRLRALNGVVNAQQRRRSKKSLRYAIETQQTVDQLLAAHGSTTDRIRASLRMGDLYIRAGQAELAQEYYLAARNMTAQDDSTDWSGLFQQPELIDPGPDMDILQLVDEGLPFYEFKTTILADGSPKKIGVVNTNLHIQTRTYAVQLFRQARFRPRLSDDGTPLQTDNFVFKRIYPQIVRVEGFMQPRVISH